MAELKIITQNLGAGYCEDEIQGLYRELYQGQLNVILENREKEKGKELSEEEKKEVEKEVEKEVAAASLKALKKEKIPDYVNKKGLAVLEQIEEAKSLTQVKLMVLEAVKDRYMHVYGADIYAFQELGRIYINPGHVNKVTETFIYNKKFRSSEDTSVSGRAEEIWDEAFPWAEFVDGFWDERGIEFAGHKIKIINFHSSFKHDLGIRYTLLGRLSELPKSKLIILLGDFNSSFLGQTESNKKDVIRNAEFLERIKSLGFTECMASDESEGVPYYTHCYTNNRKQIRNKLDHIFISKSFFELLKESAPNKDNKEKPYTIEYIHAVNRNPPQNRYKTPAVKPEGKELEMEPFTDHSGIKLTIWLPDPEADSKQAEASAP